MTHKVSIFLLVASLLLSLLAACSSTPAAPAVALSDAEIQAISMPIAQNIITSLADENYEGFTRDFDETMKKAITEQAFTEVRTMFWEDFGNYQSMQIQSTSIEQNMLLVYYLLKFDKGELTMQLVHQSQPPHQISGLWFPPK